MRDRKRLQIPASRKLLPAASRRSRTTGSTCCKIRFALDGRVSSYPASARGFSVVNSYLLTQPDAAMLIDTGFGKDEPVIRAQIESLIAPRPAAVAVSTAAQ